MHLQAGHGSGSGVKQGSEKALHILGPSMTTGLFVETYSRLKDNGVSCDACTRPTSLPRSRSANHRSCQQPGPGAAPAATAPGCRRTDLSARVRGCQGTPAAFPTATASARWQAPVPTGPVLRLSLETGGACAASVASLVPPPPSRAPPII